MLEEQNEMINKQKEELATMNATKDKFFSIIAHDLKGPFNSLLGAAELLMDDSYTLEEKDIKRLSDQIYKTARNVYNLLENLLTWASTQIAGSEAAPEKLNLNEMIINAIGLFKHTTEKKELSITSNIENQIDVFTDKNMTESVIRNLIFNAIKFTPKKGTIEIGAKGNGKYVEVYVKDTGVGIRQNDIDKLFRLDSGYKSEGTENEKGTGLGLILSKEFVQKNGGEIWVESEEGKGSTFRFTLPLA